jgi:hypothetical protein
LVAGQVSEGAVVHVDAGEGGLTVAIENRVEAAVGV